ncbi:MAG: T9SS type A sorting domain-containing protein [Chlorobi bacterium]|nr:T9SS type A sorting domain-containing protein [Chlorobiota bacterium]
MKTVILILVSFLSLTNVFGQNSWEWQNFTPGELSSVCFADNLNGWAVSWNGEILHTTNGGKEWEYQRALPIQTEQYIEVFFLDKNEGWICGRSLQEASLLYTTNSGETWERQSNFAARKNLYSIFFIDENNGWIGSDSGKIFRTIDGGESWDEVTVNPGEWGNSIWSIQFLNKNTGFAIMGKSIIKTEDGGASWQIKYTDDNYNYSLSTVYFLDSLNGWVIGEIRKLIHTTDGGNTWIEDSTVAKWGGYLSDIYFADTLHGIIIGRYGIDAEKGFICKTIDGGANWTRKEEMKALNSISAVDKKHIWTVGLSSIYYSNNFGVEWESQVSDITGMLSSLCFIDDVHGWTTSWTFTPGLFETTDGGNSWVKKLDVRGRDLSFIDNYGWVLASHSIYSSNDNFDTWIEQPLEFFVGGAESIYFVNKNLGFCVGWFGPIIKTVDGGDTWTALDTSKHYYLRSVYFLDENHGWAAGTYFAENNQPGDPTYGHILRTTDGGQTWSEYVTDDGFSLRDIFFIDKNTGWAVGGNADHYEYPLLHTIDGGISWSKQSSFSSNSLRSVYFIDKNTGWVTNSNGTIFKSTDGGNTWNAQFSTNTSSGRGFSLNAIQFINRNIGWVVGDNGVILKTINGGSTFVNNNGSLQYYRTIQLYRNFPNPFNPSTTIEYQIPRNGGLVKLKVYDITGQEIAKLVNKEQAMGKYKVVFDASRLSSGVYFYRLQFSSNNDRSFTKSMKMVLLK